MSDWVVSLTCIKCGRGVVEAHVEADTEQEAMRKAESEHNQFHESRGDIGKLWPDFACWAEKVVEVKAAEGS